MTDNLRTNFCPCCKTLADDLEAMTNARNDALSLVEHEEKQNRDLREILEDCVRLLRLHYKNIAPNGQIARAERLLGADQ